MAGNDKKQDTLLPAVKGYKLPKINVVIQDGVLRETVKKELIVQEAGQIRWKFLEKPPVLCYQRLKKNVTEQITQSDSLLQSEDEKTIKNINLIGGPFYISPKETIEPPANNNNYWNNYYYLKNRQQVIFLG